MELNSLNIPETNRRDLQRLLDQAYAGYVADLDALADEAADAIEAQYRSNPLFMRDVVEDYSRQSAQLADDYFSQLRAIWPSSQEWICRSSNTRICLIQAKSSTA